MASEYPKTFYRYDETGERVGKTFACAEDVEKGWVSFEDLPPPPPKKAVAAVSGKEAGDAAKRLVAAESEVARLKDTLKLYEDETRAKDETLAAYKEFLSALREDDNAPEPLKTAIAKLLGEVLEEASPTPAKRPAKK